MRVIFIISFIFILNPFKALEARVHEVKITDRVIIADGANFGRYGSYERLKGTIQFKFDPENEQNWNIIDLEHAPIDANGMVTATANFMVLQPTDPELGRGLGFLEVSNRGGKATMSYFNGAQVGSSDPIEAEQIGDGLLLRQGMTIIWVGWQYDVERIDGNMWLEAPIAINGRKAINGLVRSDWVIEEHQDSLTLGHRGAAAYYLVSDITGENNVLTVRVGRNGPRTLIPKNLWRFGEVVDGTFKNSSAHISLEGGFKLGKIYELVYESEDPIVAGIGLAVIRDTVSYAKNDLSSLFYVNNMIGFGVSQTGRFLRHFLYQGFNTDVDGNQVFDGVIIHAAGAGRGSFNHRFAQPSRDGHRFSTFFSPTDIFPFTSQSQRNPITREREGLFSNVEYPNHIPKIMTTNTGYEYWGRAASLIHTNIEGNRDLSLMRNERVYHIAGAQHFVVGPPPNYCSNTGTHPNSGSAIDFLVNLRALALQMASWVEEDEKPPESTYPRVSNSTLVDITNLNFPVLPNESLPNVLHTAYYTDFGERWFDGGIIDNQPPILLGEIIPKVPQVDNFGNEISGIQNIELRVPLASFAPWNLRGGDYNPNELSNFCGTTFPLSRDEGAKLLTGDTRPSINGLYLDRDDYLYKVNREAQNLVNKRFLLNEDIPRVMMRASNLWSWIVEPQKTVGSIELDKIEKEGTL